MNRHLGAGVLLVFTTLSAGQTTRPDVRQALASHRDVWGEAAIKQPQGPNYEFFEPLLAPLRYVNTEFRHYPIALAAPLSKNKFRLVSNGSGVNLPAGINTWYDYPLGVRFKVGEEVFGADLERLTGPVYEKGYLPIVRMSYRVGDAEITQKTFADHSAIRVQFSIEHGESAEVNLQTIGDAKLLRLGDGWNDRRATIRPNQPAELAVYNAPHDEPARSFEDRRKTCESTWQSWLEKCVNLDVPEERVNRAWKSMLIGNLMMASDDQMSYSAGNVYQRLYEAESGDALRAIMLFGLTDQTKLMLDPLLKYHQEGLGFHDAAFKLQLLAHVYWITRDHDMVKSRRELWQPAIDLILRSREKDSGLLPKENYCGDIHTQVYSLNSNANSWRALRDMSAVLRDMREDAEAKAIADAGSDFRAHILTALDKSERRDISPTFIPIALFGAEQPYEKLTDSMLGSYWNLMIPYVLGSDILDEKRESAVIDYLHTHGGVCMGMIRFDQHSGLFANENGVDDLYGLRYVQTLLRRDEVDRVLVSFYGKLAHGVTRDTFIGGEGSSFIALDDHGRPMYLPPNASGNAFFLAMLREMLVQDADEDRDGKPDSLRLLFATPKSWLEDGKTIRIERAPTAFGPVSIVARSDLRNNRVVVDVTEPPGAKLPIRLRVRPPDGWKVAAASIGGIGPLKLDDQATVDLPFAREAVSVEFALKRVER